MIRRRQRESITLYFVRPNGALDWLRGADIDDLRRFVRRYPLAWVIA